MPELKRGDIFELETKKGFAYVQLVELRESDDRLDKIRVFYELHNSRPNNFEGVFENEFFYLKFVLREAWRRKIFKKIGSLEINQLIEFPSFFRTKHIFQEGCWQIVDGNTYKRETIEVLNEEQIKLSPWGTWNDTLLIENLENGWRLDNWI